MDLTDLTTDQIRLYKNAFSKCDNNKNHCFPTYFYLKILTRFDKKNVGIVNAKQVLEILKYVGHNPTEAELQDLINAVDKDATGTIDFPEFLLMMSIKNHDSIYEDQVREAFKVFDYVSRIDFILILL